MMITLIKCNGPFERKGKVFHFHSHCTYVMWLMCIGLCLLLVSHLFCFVMSLNVHRKKPQRARIICLYHTLKYYFCNNITTWFSHKVVYSRWLMKVEHPNIFISVTQKLEQWKYLHYISVTESFREKSSLKMLSRSSKFSVVCICCLMFLLCTLFLHCHKTINCLSHNKKVTTIFAIFHKQYYSFVERRRGHTFQDSKSV